MILLNEATIIRKDKMHDFINELKNNQISPEYWKECAAAKKAFPSEKIERMKKMCNEDL